MTALLDVNVLIALIDGRHIAHSAAQAWFVAHHKNGWATCPLTENAVLRIMGRPAYPDGPGDVALIADLLSRLTSMDGHVFWPDDISMLSSVHFVQPIITGTKQLTDIYLLALAASNAGKLVTFDQRMRTAPVIAGQEALWVIG